MILKVTALASVLLLASCASSVAGRYGVEQSLDAFNNTQDVSMSGGVIDADYLGIVANAAEFNPYVSRTSQGGIKALGIAFTYENPSKWLNIRKGSSITFLLNGGGDRVVIKALDGDIDHKVSMPQRTVYTTKYDYGVFPISPQQLKKLAYATDVQVRVVGVSSREDFPRKPNNSLLSSFLPNVKKFYETQVAPYLK